MDFFPHLTKQAKSHPENSNIEITFFLSSSFFSVQAPVPAGAWQGELNATEDNEGCPQGYAPYYSGNEDCLFLNVYTPQVSECYKYITVAQVFKMFIVFHGTRKVIKINFTL